MSIDVRATRLLQIRTNTKCNDAHETVNVSEILN